ncbi:MAG: ATP-binding protein, partial [Bacteroidota bacterium]|nr:ATP-binding protein [Bacteroidota bacterium]
NILSKSYSSFIGASNYQVGQDAGAYASNVLKRMGKVLEIGGVDVGSSADIGRDTGFRDFIKKYPGIDFIERLSEDWDNRPLEAENDLSGELTKHNDINLIFCQNDRIALGAYNVCRKLGIQNKVSIIGVDGLPGRNGGIELVNEGKLKATILYPTGGKEAIETAIDILEKKPFKKEISLGTTVIDSTNVRIMKLQNEKVLAQQTDIDKRQKKIEEQIVTTRNQANIIVAISITLALALIFGGILFYYLLENKKINKKLEFQKNEIAYQRNQLIDMAEKVKEATNAKFNFFTNISHELRTPLTLIMGPLEDALSSPKLHFTIKNNLDFIYRNSLRLLRLINQLMDFRKIEEGKMNLKVSENNITEFVIDISNAFRDMARKKSISFNVVSKVPDLKLWFDETMLDKVLFNILSNAFKFTPENGVISLVICKSSDGRMANIKIEDSGIGMTPEDVNHAFDLFYQGRSGTFKGTGLGLSLSKELISLHHGTIVLTSEKGKGTFFEISLPIGNAHLQPEEILLNKPTPINTYEDIKIYMTDVEPLLLENGMKLVSEKENSILVIEDSEDLRAFLNSRLGETYEVHEAENGVTGIKLAYDIVPDLIISDIILPMESGLKVTEILKNDIRTSHIPIILLTAKSSLAEQIEGIRSKADAFIVKPFNLEYLEETIKNLLRNRSVLREHYTSELPTETRSNLSSKIDRKFLHKFTSIVENNLSNEYFSVEQICKEIGVSRVQLYRKVKALVGFNVNDYILNVRLHKAKFLLAEQQLPISEVAFKVGFSTQAYFSTVFKSKFSLTPSEYREKKKRVK